MELHEVTFCLGFVRSRLVLFDWVSRQHNHQNDYQYYHSDDTGEDYFFLKTENAQESKLIRIKKVWVYAKLLLYICMCTHLYAYCSSRSL